MSVQQLVTVYINLKGDGSSTTFVFPMSNLYVQSFGGSIPYGSAGVVPSAIAINNPPVPVTSATVDTFGNITITLTTALGSGVVANFELDLSFNSGAATSTTVVQTDEVAVFGHANAIMDVVIGGATAAANALQVAGVYNSVAPTLTTGQGAAIQLDSSGNLKVNIVAGSSGNSAASATGSAVPADADYLGVNIGGTLTGVTGVSLTNAKAATVAIVDGSGNQITSFGGGSQFAMGSAQSSSALGTISLGYDGANVRGLLTDAVGNLKTSPGVLVVNGNVWTSATTGSTLQYPNGTTVIGSPLGASAILVNLVQSSGTFTGGQVT